MKRHPNFLKRPIIASTGYEIVYVGNDHHLNNGNGYAYKHRIVMEEKLGRKLNPGEVVHHIDGNRLNNDPENLVAVKSNGAHLNLHRSANCKGRLHGEPNPIIKCACGCGREFEKYDATGRPRKYWTSCRIKGPKIPLDETIIECACGCGTKIKRMDSSRRIRKFVSGHNARFEWNNGKRKTENLFGR